MHATDDIKPALERAIQLGASCAQCPLKDLQGPVYFKPKAVDSGYDFDITVVAERPGDTELGAGQPLAGRSGWLLQKMLKEMHVTNPQVHLTNATLCTTSTLLQDKSWSAAVNCCRPRLANELSNNRRQLVFLLGKRALQAVTGKDSIKAWRGFPVSPLELFDRENTIYFPTYHPAHILREAAYAAVWKLDFARAFAYASGKLKPVEWPRTLVDDDETTAAALEGILHSVEARPTELGLDVETAGKEPMLVDLLCIGLASKELALSLPLHSRVADVNGLFRRILSHHNAQFITQNGIHDLLSLEAHNFHHLRIAFDTLTAARIAYPRIDHALGTVASLHHFIPRHKAQYRSGDADTKGENAWGKAAKDPSKFRAMRIYNARDAWTTLMCKEPLERMLG